MWIARDKDGALNVWEELPHRSIHGYWETYGTNNHIILDYDAYPDLKWEDEPLYYILRTNEDLAAIRDKVFWDTKKQCEKYVIDLLPEYLSNEYGLDKTELEETIKHFYKEE